MQLLETRQIDHQIEIFDDTGKLRIKLSDDSGDGYFLDIGRPLRERDGGRVYNVYLEAGFSTPCGVAEASYLLGKTGQSVERIDWDRTDHRFPHHFSIPASLIPQDDKLRQHLLDCDPSSGIGYTGNKELDAMATIVCQAQAAKTNPLF